MPPVDAPRALGAVEFRELVKAIAEAVAEEVRLPALLRQEDVPGYLGVSRSAFFRLKGATGFPREVRVEGAGVHYRRADLDAWVGRLRPGRK